MLIIRHIRLFSIQYHIPISNDITDKLWSKFVYSTYFMAFLNTWQFDCQHRKGHRTGHFTVYIIPLALIFTPFSIFIKTCKLASKNYEGNFQGGFLNKRELIAHFVTVIADFWVVITPAHSCLPTQVRARPVPTPGLRKTIFTCDTAPTSTWKYPQVSRIVPESE